MPLALDPHGPLPLVLESDESKPKDQRPTFYSRALTYREQKIEQAKLKENVKFLDRVADDDERQNAAIDQLWELIKIKPWENMIDPATGEAFEFKKENLELMLSKHEIGQLLVFAINNLYYSEKKSSESQP